MRPIHLALILSCCCLAAPAAERVPPDARWMAHLDVAALLRSQTGTWLKEQLAQQPHAARLAMLNAVSGIDVVQDLHHITVSGIGADDASGLVQVRGRFDAAKLETVVQATEEHAVQTFGQRRIHTWRGDDGKPVAGCLAAPDLLLLGKDPQRLRAGLRLADDATAPAASFSVPAGWAGSALLLCAADDIAALAGPEPASAMLRQLRGVAARLGEEGPLLTFEARTQTRDAAAAQQLIEAGRGLMALVQLQQPANLDAALVESLRGAELSRDGDTALLRLRLPVADAVRLIAEQQAAKRKP
jgi:hypothetical protein